MSEIMDQLAVHPCVDPAALNELRAFQEPGEDDFVGELIDIFLEDCPTRLDTIRTGIEQNDPSAVAGAAHALKSSSAQLGALRMSAICQILETNGKADSLENAEELGTELLDEFQRVTQQFRADG